MDYTKLTLPALANEIIQTENAIRRCKDILDDLRQPKRWACRQGEDIFGAYSDNRAVDVPLPKYALVTRKFPRRKCRNRIAVLTRPAHDLDCSSR